MSMLFLVFLNLAVLPDICPTLHSVEVVPPDDESSRSTSVSSALHHAKPRHPNVNRTGRKSCVMCGCSAFDDFGGSADHFRERKCNHCGFKKSRRAYSGIFEKFSTCLQPYHLFRFLF